jgi:hypothetical protein
MKEKITHNNYKIYPELFDKLDVNLDDESLLERKEKSKEANKNKVQFKEKNNLYMFAENENEIGRFYYIRSKFDATRGKKNNLLTREIKRIKNRIQIVEDPEIKRYLIM